MSRDPSIPSDWYDENYYLTDNEGYKQWAESKGAQLSARHQYCVKLADLRPGMTTLDYGCGRGEIVRYAASLGCKSYGLDYSPAAIRMARETCASLDAAVSQNANVSLLGPDCNRLPFPDGFLDAIFLIDVIEHLHEWEARLLLEEVRRTLKDNGRLILHTGPNKLFFYFGYRFFTRYVNMTANVVLKAAGVRAKLTTVPAVTEKYHVNEQSKASLRRLLREAGLDEKTWLVSRHPTSERPGLVKRVCEAAYRVISRPAICWPLDLIFAEHVWAIARRRR